MVIVSKLFWICISVGPGMLVANLMQNIALVQPQLSYTAPVWLLKVELNAHHLLLSHQYKAWYGKSYCLTFCYTSRQHAILDKDL